ncbi:MAG TPA: BatA domain-containing protein [Gemmatimonadaceae bacterium]|nr:BatA domain-containing protein [Gemmatimonadaceae bacterium]
MNFLSPLFLAGLAALAIPVLIHLINREKKVVVQFPSLMFLHKIPYKSVRRQKIRHLLLLLLRCLALALFVAAFARPWFDRSKHAGAGATSAREVVLLIDRSYSMGYGNRWQTALDKAREITRAINPQDRATIVFFANEPSAATEPTADRSRLENALKTAKLSSEGTRFAPAIKFATEIVAGSNLPRKDVVLISDFQKAGWAKREELSLPPDVTLRTIDVANADGTDAGVIGVTTERVRDSVRERVTVTARVANLGVTARTAEASLDLGGRRVETKRITLPPRAAQRVRFASVSVPATATRGIVRISADSLPADDEFFFTVAPDEAVSVLIIEPASARPNQSLYLRTALSIGDKPRFRVDVRTPNELRGADLEGRSLFILNEAAPPSGAVGARMREAVLGGAGLFIAPGEQEVGRWPSEWKALLPATVGIPVDHMRTAGVTIGAVDYTNPIFDVFSAPRSGDFAAARVFRYRKLAATGDSGILAKFDDGAPAMVTGRAGTGRVVIWATSMDASWTDLPMQTVFVPFVHQVGKRVGRFADSRQWFTAGEVLDLSRHAELTAPLAGSGPKEPGDSVRLILEAPSGEKTRLSVLGTNHLATLRERGLYELRGETDPVGAGRPIAVNVDPAEADLSHLDPEELVAAASATTAKVAAAEAVVAPPEQQESRQTVWWYLLLAALFLLAVETVLSNRLSRVTS